jgi:hypothetical protein
MRLGTAVCRAAPLLLFMGWELACAIETRLHLGFEGFSASDLLRLRHFFLLKTLVNLFSMHCHPFGRVNSDLDLIAFRTQHGDRNVRPNYERFPDPPRQNQHQLLPDSPASPSGSAILGRSAWEGT